MADPQRHLAAPAGAALVSSALLGALAGAGGLALWLWHQRRRHPSAPAEAPSRLSRPRGATIRTGRLAGRLSQREALPNRVQQLNQAIEDVRRQLEALQSNP